MKMDSFWILSCLLLLVTVTTAGKQPNILLVVADDYGWNDVGYHGSDIKTPNLDKLASEGVKLENYYIQPICTPSRSQLMSGRYQIHTGLQHGVIKPPVPNSLPLEMPTMADKLQEAGYSTHIVGKWHLGFYKKECTPTYRGFDSFFGYLIGAEDYFEHTRCDEGCGYDLHDDERNADEYKGQYSAFIFSKRIQKIATQHAQHSGGKPLFMYAPFQSVHEPLQVPEQYIKQYQHIDNKARRTYAGMVTAMDEAIGNITETYKALGLWENTIMIFSTDNGGQVHAGGNNWPLRGWKGTLWEGGVHGVGFVSGGALPNTQVRGSSSKALVHITDWFPTVVGGLAGGETKGLALDGHDVWTAISEGKDGPRKELLHNIDPLTAPIGQPYPHSRFDSRVRAALRVGDYKLITGDPGEGKWIPPPKVDFNPEVLEQEESSVMDSTFDYSTGDFGDFDTRSDTILRFRPSMMTSEESVVASRRKEPQNVWLFNIKEDPTEHNDLASSMPALVEDLLNRLADYNATAVPCRFPPADPQANPELHGGYWGPWVV